jgi:hypothetical protein
MRFFSADAMATPREAINGKLVFAVVSACMAGSLFGFDTGNIGGIIVLPSFKKTFGLTADGPNAYQAPTLSANIVTTLQAGAVIGSLFAYTIADRLGRRKALIIGAAIFLVGCALQLIASLSKFWEPCDLNLNTLTDPHRNALRRSCHCRYCHRTLLRRGTYVCLRKCTKGYSRYLRDVLQPYPLDLTVACLLDQCKWFP